ncbi:putative ribonuclease H-like domain-containing protein, partial [Tanacetum coccineum]
SKGNQDSRRRDAWNTGNKDKENGRRSGKQEDSKALVTLDGEGVDWTSHSEDEQENYALMACSSSGSDTEMSARDNAGLGYGDQMNKGVLSYENEVFQSVFVSKISDMKISHVMSSDFNTCESNCIVKETHESMPEPVAQGTLKYNVQRENKLVWNNVQRVNHKNQFVPTAVLTRTGKIPVNTARASGTNNVSTARHNFNSQAVLTNAARKINTVKPIVNEVRPKTVFHKTHSPFRRTFNRTTASRTKFSNQKVNTAEVKSVSAVGGKWETAVKPSAGCNWRPKRHGWNKVSKYNGGSNTRNCDYPQGALKNKGIVDSGCSRHMTGNKAYLAEYQDYNGGPVVFGGSKGYITGKGKIKTGKLDFEDVCFVKELQHFNLFSVSQICDKKNKVLFTDTECLVLSPDFKLPDENQVLLKVPRQNNMYSFNLENIVPSGGLACLIAKATVDESNKWHRRLGHVNFKNLNKLVKGNLVRGLPSKIFQNDHTCVACQKGKQHKASCKAKSVSSISQPLQLLHMDLFGPTSVRSINHKTYCLVITDDFSRFSWVFFLRTKDETSGILKDFIRQIKNQLNQKVKTIRCDNGTEFKNRDIIELCGSKGIKREYSNARTPQQNGVAERKNMTLIEAARTMSYVTPAHTQKTYLTEPNKTPSPTYLVQETIPPVMPCPPSHDTIQDSRDSLEGTNRSEGDQVQSSHDSPLSGDHTSEKAEGGLNLEELFVLCTNLSNRFLSLETSNDAQAAEILKLKDQIKKLKRKCNPSISHHRAWLKSVKRLSMKKMLGGKEYVSKQGRKNVKPKPTLDAFDDLDADGRDYMETKDVVKEGRQSNETDELNKGSGDKGGSTKELVSTVVPKTVSTARPELSTARQNVDAAWQEDSDVEPRTSPTTTSIFDNEDISMAQTLIKMKEDKAKEKGVSIKDIEDSSRPARSILTLKPLPTIDPKDKGKSVLEEPEPAKKMTRKVERERQREKEASKAAIAETYDKVQAGIDVDALAAQRSAEIRSRPPTKSQLRNLMMTYLKNMGGYKHSQLKAKTFAEIQGLYKRQKRVIDDFKPMDLDDAVKDSKEAAGVHKQKVLEELNTTKVEVKQEGHEESIRKRPCRRLKMKATKKSKRQKTDADLVKEEQLKAFLKIVSDEEGIIDYEVLEKRSNGSSRWIKTFSEMVTRFDRLDLEELYNLVMKRFETTTPEGVDLVLWGDLRIMFDANAEDELWQNQERWNLKSWDFYENCGVHTLILEDGTEIHMLAERKYPLTKETLERMLSLRLVAGTASEDAYTLLRFIQKQIDEYGSHDGGEKDL